MVVIRLFPAVKRISASGSFPFIFRAYIHYVERIDFLRNKNKSFLQEPAKRRVPGLNLNQTQP
jgi:hypothetical protein